MNLSVADLSAISEALQLATAAVHKTGIRLDGPVRMQITTPAGDYVNVDWTDADGGQYVLSFDQY